MPCPHQSAKQLALHGFLAFACAHVLLVSLIQQLHLAMPSLWWSGLGVIPTLPLLRLLKQIGKEQLRRQVVLAYTAFAVGTWAEPLSSFLKAFS